MTSRVGDRGAGQVTAIFVSGASTVKINGKPAMNVGGIGVTSKKKLSVALEGESTVNIEGKSAHNNGTRGTGGGKNYVVVSGSPDTLVKNK